MLDKTSQEKYRTTISQLTNKSLNQVQKKIVLSSKLFKYHGLDCQYLRQTDRPFRNFGTSKSVVKKMNYVNFADLLKLLKRPVGKQTITFK